MRQRRRKTWTQIADWVTSQHRRTIKSILTPFAFFPGNNGDSIDGENDDHDDDEGDGDGGESAQASQVESTTNSSLGGAVTSTTRDSALRNTELHLL